MKTRTPKRVIERRNLPKFGDAVEGELNVTTPSPDFISIEHPDDQLLEDSESSGLEGTLANFILKQQERAYEREHDIDTGFSEVDKPVENVEASGKYVPPGARRSDVRRGGTLESAFGNMSNDQNPENTIRVSNLTKAVTEEDLRALFEPFGRVHRVSLPKAERKDADGHIVKEPKGFAYIAYVNRRDAEHAMERLQGHGYDHLILKLEWAKAPKDGGMGGGGGLSHGFVSGYGTQLAQDTKEKVLYASNLTGNR